MVDRCVCCGEIIPEGRQICPICEKGTKKMAELKPCPFCGGKAIFKSTAIAKGGDSVGYDFEVVCGACGATRREARGTAYIKLQYDGTTTVTNGKSLEVAEREWNRRAEDGSTQV